MCTLALLPGRRAVNGWKGEEQSVFTHKETAGGDQSPRRTAPRPTAGAFNPDTMREVAVRISAALAAPPAFAREAWLQHIWARGGTLPIVVLERPEDKRLILPLLLEERLVEENTFDFKYAVTSNGLLSPDLEPPPSHSASVSFEPGPDGGSQMTWDVNFGVLRRPELYEAITRATVGGSVASLVSYCRPRPLRYTLVASLDGCSSASAALDEWLSFVWREGGGLPLPPPLKLSEEADGRLELLRIPHPLLREKVDLVDRAANAAEYIVANPSLLTFPVHTHRGRVAFDESSDAGVVMRWTVDLRPYDGLEFVVKGFTQLVLTTMTRNLQRRFAGAAEPAPLEQDEWTELPFPT